MCKTPKIQDLSACLIRLPMAAGLLPEGMRPVLADISFLGMLEMLSLPTKWINADISCVKERLTYDSNLHQKSRSAKEIAIFNSTIFSQIILPNWKWFLHLHHSNQRRDGWVADTSSLLNCRTGNCTGGSNPPLSAVSWKPCDSTAFFNFHATRTIGLREQWKLKKAPECNEGGFQLTDRPPLGSLKVIPLLE